MASRKRKLTILTDWIEPGASVLVVGASGKPGLGTQSVVERGLAAHANVVALTYEELDGPVLESPTVRGDGRRLPFKDEAFDYVVSNAVIEHLGGRAGALMLLEESARVARAGWAHATPNRRFPIEVHTGVPFLHWLPRRTREWAFNVLGKPFPEARFYLLSGRSARSLGVPTMVSRATGTVPAMTLFITSPSFARSQRGRKRAASRAKQDRNAAERIVHSQQ